ncbi:MAG TPA: mechanosensitive ion channel family protein [Thermoanaerobaculia bacterium]|nr:mechanosensitive ion channel family protein [Thermoanaerobaculia bacterium]HUM30088.1 mechanosensitive ion channel family protein [Thermoanaerobaculia bacterium]HXK68785.1 mechanosensitive ion channel family protein [Thermoanaerobaculia bacterium]
MVNAFFTLKYLEPTFWVLGGAAVGFIAEKVVLARLKRLARRSESRLDDILVASLRWMIFLWSTLLGAHVGLKSLQLPLHTSVFLSDVLTVLILVSAIIVAMRIASSMMTEYLDRYMPASTTLIRVVINLVIGTMGVLIILQFLGISITPILTTLGVGGLAVALALQDTLANLFAGLHILATRQVKPGDFIRIGSGEEGFIMDVGWRNTTIQTIQNNIVIIPNSTMASAIVTNFQLPENDFSVPVGVGVSYASDLSRVEEITLDVARDVLQTVEGGVPDFEPRVRYSSFGDSAILFNVILRTKDVQSQYILRHEFIKRLHRRYEKENINIPFPIRTVYLKQEKEDSAE